MNFAADRLVKILIANRTIAIVIKHFEHLLKLLISQVKTPMLQIKSELILLYDLIFFLIHVSKSLADSFPLELNLVNYSFLQGRIDQIFSGLLPAAIIHLLSVRLPALLKLRILYRVMPEIESLALMNRISHPLAKIRIPEHSTTCGVFLCDELFQIVKIEVL